MSIARFRNKNSLLTRGIENIKQIYSQEKYGAELHHFPKILNGEIQNISITIIYSSGYVLDTLEPSLWCLLNTVLKAVNLRKYTDTTGAITGGLAGIYYSIENIPNKWIEIIARK